MKPIRWHTDTVCLQCLYWIGRFAFTRTTPICSRCRKKIVVATKWCYECTWHYGEQQAQTPESQQMRTGVIVPDDPYDLTKATCPAWESSSNMPSLFTPQSLQNLLRKIKEASCEVLYEEDQT